MMVKLENIQSKSAKLLIQLDSKLGEGPIWHSQNQKYYWVDIEKGHLYTCDSNSSNLKLLRSSKYISFVLESDIPEELVISSNRKLQIFNIETSEVETVLEIENTLENNRFNDAKVDVKGSIWAGTMDITAKDSMGSLYCITGSKFSRKLSNLTIPNGTIWSRDNKIMYFIDTADRAIKAYDFDFENSLISNERLIFQFSDSYPDGMTISNQGLLFVAMWGGAKVSVIDPIKGELIDTINVDALNITSCVFGGENYDELFITTARSGMSDEELLKYPLSGSVFMYKSNYKGFQSNKALINYER